jgi:CHRD domain
MKRSAILAAALLASPAFADNPRRMQATLDGYQEVPSVATRASGLFTARPNSERSEVEYTLTYAGMQAPVTQAHIHMAQTAVNGAIVVWLCGSATNPGPAGTPACPQGAGTVSGIFRAADVLATPTTQQLAAGQITAFVEAMRSNAAYVNVHTTASPGGEIRGQIFGWGR